MQSTVNNNKGGGGGGEKHTHKESFGQEIRKGVMLGKRSEVKWEEEQANK